MSLIKAIKIVLYNKYFDLILGTGLTPIQSNPLIPCSTQNRNPMEMLNTPTSNNESKLVSL